MGRPCASLTFLAQLALPGLCLATLACGSTAAGDDGHSSETGASESSTDSGETGEIGEADERCLDITVLDPQPCQVLSSGLAIVDDGESLTANLLAEDGSLTPVAALPAALECANRMAHDPSSGTLWWIEPANPVAATPTRLYQYDLARESSVWQRDLPQVQARSIVHHEGGLYLAGYLSDPEDFNTQSWLERADPEADGAPVWTQIGQPGFGPSADDDGEPLHTIRSVFGLDGALGLVAAITPDESSSVTLATADPATGALMWSTSVIRDDYYATVHVHGAGDLLVSLVGWSGHDSPDATAKTDLVATTALGQPRWQLDKLPWPGFLTPRIAQLVLDDHIVHIVAEGETVMPKVVLRDHAGEVVCEAELPELLATGSPGEGLRAWGVRGQFAVVQDGSNEQRRTLLLQPR